MEGKSSDAMDRFIRGERFVDQSGGQNQITPEQADRIEKYMDLGSSYEEARDLVLGWKPGEKDKVPSGNAGSGTGAAPRSEMSMDEFIRRASGR